MENVARINEREIDLREYESALIRAEQASLTALEECSNATAAFVGFVRKMGLSPAHPRVRDMLKRVPVVMEKAAALSYDLSDCHKAAQKIVDKSNHEVVLSGGYPKTDPQEFV